MNRLRGVASLLIVIVDAGLVAWCAMAAAWPDTLVSAMTYDNMVNAIGPFELTEYLGLALVYGALAVTAPVLAAQRPVRSMV